MSKYFSTIEKNNGMYIGVVFESGSNREVYRSEPHLSQAEVSRVINSYLTGEQISPIQMSTPSVDTPTIKPTPTTRRCCGR